MDKTEWEMDIWESGLRRNKAWCDFQVQDFYIIS